MLLKDYKLISPTIQNDIKAALAKHGLDVAKWSVGVEETMGEISFKIVARDTNMGETPDAIRWKQYASMYGLHPEWLNCALVFSNGPAKIVGLLNTRGSKNVVLESPQGKRLVCTAEALRRVAAKSNLPAPPDFQPL